MVDPFRSTSEGRSSDSGHGVAQTQGQSPFQLMHSNVRLRERVEKLESHNKQLEDYISQLKSYAQMVCTPKLFVHKQIHVSASLALIDKYIVLKSMN